MMVVVVREVLPRLVTRLVLASLQVPLHVLDLVQDLTVLLAQLRTLYLQVGQVLFAGFVVLAKGVINYCQKCLNYLKQSRHRKAQNYTGR